MKSLYLKGLKRLLFQNQQVRNYFFRFRRYEALAKPIKTFLKQPIKFQDVGARTTIKKIIKEIVKRFRFRTKVFNTKSTIL